MPYFDDRRYHDETGIRQELKRHHLVERRDESGATVTTFCSCGEAIQAPEGKTLVDGFAEHFLVKLRGNA